MGLDCMAEVTGYGLHGTGVIGFLAGVVPFLLDVFPSADGTALELADG